MRYRLLGPVEVERAGVPLDLGGPKQRAVLALLLLSPGRVVSTDRLVQAVWGEEAPGSVRAGLQAYISNLRRILRDGRSTAPLLRQPPGYVLLLGPDDRLDTLEFAADCRRARQAVAEADWTTAVAAARAALALAAEPVAVEFADQEWVQGPALLLAEQRAAVEQDLVTALLGDGQVDQAVAHSADLATRHPLAERVWWLHLTALHRAGRSAQALEAYRVFAAELDRELGLDVGPDLRDLQGAILRQDPALARWPGPARPAGTAPEPVAPSSVPASGSGADRPAAPPLTAGAPVLVGRRRELDQVRELLRLAPTTGPSWLVVTGPAGIGKSRLAEEARVLWQSGGGRVVRATCPDDDSMPAWWPIRQMLTAAGVDPATVLTPPPDVDADEARFAVYERIRAVVGGLTAAMPLLILVEDVHWADAATVAFMRFVAQIEQRLPLAVVLTVRDGEGGVEVQRLLEAVARRPGSVRIALPPLNRAEVAELADRTGGDLTPAEVDQLARRTGGNPFFVSEYARLPAEERARGDIPVAVRSVLERRLAGLDPGVVEVLRVAAALGDPLDLDLLTRASRLDPDELADRLDEAADDRIVVPDADGHYRFAHALLRDQVLAGMPPLRRQRLHLRIAETIGEAATGDRLTRRAGQLVAALPLGDAGLARDACVAAARQAERDWHYDAAAHWWETAVRAADRGSPEPTSGTTAQDRDELVVARIAALAHIGRGQTVLDTVDAALVDAVRAGNTAAVGRLAATLLRTTGSWPWAVYGEDPGPLLSRLAGLVDVVRADPAAHARVLAALACGSCYDPDESVPDTLSRRAVTVAEATADPEVLADALLGRMLTRSGVAGSAAETLDLARRLAGLEHRLAAVDEVLGHNLLSLACMTLGRVDQAQEHVRLGELGCDLLRMPVSRVQLRWAAGSLALWRGDDEEARRRYERAAALHSQTELYQAGTTELALFALAWHGGRLADLDLGPTVAAPTVSRWLPLFRPAGPDPDLDARLAAEVDRPEPSNWLTHGRLTVLGHTVADRGIDRLAGPLLERLLPFRSLLATLGQVGVVGTVDLALARLQQLAGDRTAARAHLEAARSLAAASGGRPELRRCHELADRWDTDPG